MMAVRDRTIRNVILLAFCQALAMSAMSVSMTVTVLVGEMLTRDPALATVPLALQFTAVMMTTIPASLLMRRFGRRAGFAGGVCIGVTGGLLAVWSIFQRDYVSFCIASLLLGSFMGFAAFFRHAAADTASDAFRSKAISLVMAGGVVAALLGPELAKWSYDVFEPTSLGPVTFAGCFIAVTVLLIPIFGFLALVDIPRESALERADSGRPLLQIARQPRFLVAAICGMVGYGVMSFVMTATPLAVVACGFSFVDAAFIVQWHAFAMFAPSFVTGSLISRFGVLRVMAVGAIALFACVAVSMTGVELYQFWWGLVLLGVGWNFMFVGGTALLGECHTSAEKAKVQGFNDFLVFSTVAAASFSAGAVFHLYGWAAVNLSVLPFVGAAFMVLIWQIRAERRAASAPA